jgi:polysaccharide export outer membrane protein
MRIGYPSGKRFLQVLAAAVVFMALAASAATPKGYVMGPGDAIKISVYQNPDMTTETRVSEVGSITFPLLGPVEVGGLTPAQAEIRIAALLKSGGFVPKAQVNVFVTQFRSRQVSVLGQVTRPGRYPIEEPSIRLTDALAMAGGIGAGGAESVTVIRGGEGGGDQRFEVDLLGLFDTASQSKNLEIRDGDTIFVPRIPVFYIYGEVQKPGAYRLERRMTVMQAISLASGLTPRGSEKGLRINRRAADGSVKSVAAGVDDPIAQNDVIYVKESLF